MSKDHIITGKHHRRPPTVGGTELPANLSYVEDKTHKAWHVLVGNMNAFQICDFLNHIEFKPEGVKIICKFINGSEVKLKGENNSRNRAKIIKAWKTLFGNWEFREIIAYINNVWLDPSYHFYIKEEKREKE